jgi:dipeptidyl aminopeptidase/acylaminoacyl peptidase
MSVLLIPSSKNAPAHAFRMQAVKQRPSHYFTVRDSIEMSRFDTTDGGPVFSPDKEFFFVVTSRGVIETDSIESTLWVFRSSEIRRFLESPPGIPTPRGKPIVRLTRVPRNNYSIFYAPIISSVRWQDDSKALLFLGQNRRNERQLYRVDVKSGIVRELTPQGSDVSRYEARGKTIVYLAAHQKQTIQLGNAINSDAYDVAGEPLATFMPQIDDAALYRELWVLRNGRRWQVKENGTRAIHLANHFPEILSISPDGESVAVLEPVENVPESWERYEPAFAYLRLHPDDPNTTGRSNLERPVRYAVVELKTGKSRFILNAPQADSLGYIQENAAVWSRDGGQLLLTNAFLPLDQVTGPEESKRLKPCACAIADLKLNSSSCVAFGSYDRSTDARLVSASFAKDSNDVIVEFSTSSKDVVRETYRRMGSTWTRLGPTGDRRGESAASNDPFDEKTHPIAVEIREDPNTPPALYASEPGSARSRELFDPNPGLSSLNLGAITPFHWKDKTGYEWAGQLVKPPDYLAGRRYPLVIQTYGFSNGFVSDGLFPTASAVRAMAAVGIMVLQMPRRTDHYGTGQEAEDQIVGFESAIESLDHDGLINPEKVGIVGFSHTCYHVESALVSDSNRFAAATIADGMDGSYLQYLYSAGDPTAYLFVQMYGANPFGAGLRKWINRAPGFNLDKVHTPLRIEAIGFPSILGEWETYASLFSQGKPVDFIYLPFGDHLLQKPLERMASQQGNVDWFRFWLKGEEDPDPSKRNQYARWRKMREDLSSKTGS